MCSRKHISYYDVETDIQMDIISCNKNFQGMVLTVNGFHKISSLQLDIWCGEI